MRLEPILSYADLPHVLVVDDDKRILDLLSRYLTENGFLPVTAENTEQAKILMKDLSFDVLVLDVMMPGETGLEWLKTMKSEIPVLLLTALGESQDRIRGLSLGADDYLSKPFEPQELLLRLRAILKRTKKSMSASQAFKIGQWMFDPQSEMLEGQGVAIRLTPAETKLLRALAAYAGQAVSRETLARLCDLDAGAERTIDVQVNRLRSKIEKDSKHPLYLQTVRGKGYLLRTGEV